MNQKHQQLFSRSDLKLVTKLILLILVLFTPFKAKAYNQSFDESISVKIANGSVKDVFSQIETKHLFDSFMKPKTLIYRLM